MEKAGPAERILFLDYIRAVAILLVVAFHSLDPSFGLIHLEWGRGWWMDFGHVSLSFLALLPVSFGWAGVAIFFVVSGFCIHLSHERSRQLQIHDLGSDEWRHRAEKLERDETGTLDGLFWEGGDSFWQAGRLLHAASGKEAMFFHFHHWKHQWNSLHYSYWPGAISRIDIRPDGFKIQFQKPFYSLCFDIGCRFPHWVGGRIAPFFRLAGRIKRGPARRLFPSNL